MKYNLYGKELPEAKLHVDTGIIWAEILGLDMSLKDAIEYAESNDLEVVLLSKPRPNNLVVCSNPITGKFKFFTLARIRSETSKYNHSFRNLLRERLGGLLQR